MSQEISAPKERSYWSYKWHEIKNAKALYLFILPFMLIFFTFTILPVLISVYYGFTNFNVLEAPQWVGWDNYLRLFLEDDLFITAVKNTFLFALITGPVGYLLCLIFAWLINELTPKFRAFLTLMFYAPALSNMTVIWKFIFSSDQYGIINGFLIQNNIIASPIRFFADPEYIVPTVIFVLLWSSLGTSFLTFIAGLQNVDRSLYEAASIDGIKNRWQELWFVTLPYMRPQLMFSAIISISGAFNIGDAITVLVGYPSIDYVAHTIMHHLNDYGNMRLEMGYACAIATVLFIIMISLNKIIQKLISKVGE